MFVGAVMTESEPGNGATPPARVLVVDDHPVVIDGVRRILADTVDLQLVGEAADPASAETQARRLQPDIVILDLKLGEHLAPPLCRTLLVVSPTSAVVIHTAFDDPEPLRACLNAGATGIVLKGTRDLVEALRTVLAGNVFVDPSLTDLPAARAQNLAARNGVGASLTLREYEVLCIMALGRTSKQIAEELHLAENTVRSYVQSLLQKLQARNRIEALAKARHLRLL